MADPKDTTSFFRKVVKFVANPATEWGDLGANTSGPRESEFAKSELKAMIERKRRNDFVRKREFDMLRKVRRGGLTGEQLAALGSSSRLDDSEDRLNDATTRIDNGVKAKIDEIEQQMVGEGYGGSPRRTPAFYNAPTQPAAMGGASPSPAAASRAAASPPPAAARTPPRPDVSAPPAAASPPPAAVVSQASDFSHAFTVEVSEMAHDPDLDEAVIAFANADFDLCEQSLSTLTAADGARAQHAETWLVLFDLYRAIGEHQKFEALALEYAGRFGWSSPQWFSMPKLVAEAAEAAALEAPLPSAAARAEDQRGWVCPERMDIEAVTKLRSISLQMPLPWVFDWGALKNIDAEACAQLSELFRHWMAQKLDMRWLGGTRFMRLLADLTPTGAKDTDPAYWQLRLDALRMANQPIPFEEAAIDYCVTYEVSPPSWEPAECQVQLSGSDETASPSHLAAVSEVATSFVESQFVEEPGLVEMASLELSGQLVGDIGATIQKMDSQLSSAPVVTVSCAKLIRVDFIAAGDLLNWVLAKRGENRSVIFTESHRLIALFFGAMGINEHARVKVRNV
jgi:hypothetical protein